MLLIVGLLQVAGVAHAQTAANATALNKPHTIAEKLMRDDFDGHSLEKIYGNETNSKAVRDFTKSFKLAEDVRWYKVTDGTMVYFTDAGIKNRTGYDNNGKRLYNMRSYTEPRLNDDIRERVKTLYYDFAITSVTEITMGEQVIYLVHIAGKKSSITLRVCEGEDIEVIEKLVK